MPRRLLLVAVLAGLALAVSGCAQALSADDVEKQVTSRLTSTLNKAPEWVSCPGDLKAESGAELRCTTRFKGKIYGVAVKVTAVKAGVVTLDITKDAEPTK